jgi:hypothetical protein
MSVTARRVAGWTGVVLLVVVSLLGVQSAIGQLSEAATAGQWICTWTQWGYAVTGLVAAAGLLLRRSWHRPALWTWALCITITGGLAAVVWGGAGPLAGLAAGAATAAVAGAVMLLVNRMPREQRGAP